VADGSVAAGLGVSGGCCGCCVGGGGVEVELDTLGGATGAGAGSFSCGTLLGEGALVIGSGLLAILVGDGGGGGGGVSIVTVVALVTVIVALIVVLVAFRVVLFVVVAVTLAEDLDAVGVPPPIKAFTMPFSPLPTFPTRPPTSAAAILPPMLSTVLLGQSMGSKQVDCCTSMYAAHMAYLIPILIRIL